MFLCAQPRFNPDRNCTWDGKIGMWPLGEWVPVSGSSGEGVACTRKILAEMSMEVHRLRDLYPA